MPPKAKPNSVIFLLKTHKLTIFLSGTQSTSIASLKQDAFSALTSDVRQHAMDADEIPMIESPDDFRLVRAVKERGRPTGVYEPLDESKSVRETLLNWETLFVQFKDEDGQFLPVRAILPSLTDEDEVLPNRNAGKRKAVPD